MGYGNAIGEWCEAMGIKSLSEYFPAWNSQYTRGKRAMTENKFEIDCANALNYLLKTGRVNTAVMLTATSAWLEPRYGRNLSGAPKVMAAIGTIINEALQPLVTKFDEKVWAPDLRKFWNATPKRGHSGDGDGFRALMWGIAGRVLITIEDPQLRNSVTMCFAEEASERSRGGLQSIEGDLFASFRLLQSAIDRFPVLKPDDDVTVG
jgi:hypothetical protein